MTTRAIPLLILFLAVISARAEAQSTTYDDVGIIVNTSSPVSVNIGNYFRTARNVPAQNLILINCSTDETVDSLQFASIREQIQTYLVGAGLKDSLNYLVTTKGMPMRVSKDGTCANLNSNNLAKCTALESELVLLFSQDSTEILKDGYYFHPYFQATQTFSRAAFDMYLVTRLDGYNEDDVKSMIDRSGPETVVDKQRAIGIADYYRIGSGSESFYQSINTAVETELTALGIPTVNDIDNQSYLREEEYVVAFHGALHDSLDMPLNFIWEKGSVAHNFNSHGLPSNYDSLNTDGLLTGADLIAEGATAVAVYTSLTYASPSTKADQFYKNYFDSTQTLNLAESYYIATIGMSSAAQLIGDPKASIVYGVLADREDEDPELIRDFTLFPNPGNGLLNLQGVLFQSQDLRIQVQDLQGRLVHQTQLNLTSGVIDVQLDLQHLRAGMYLLQASSNQGRITKKFVIR